MPAMSRLRCRALEPEDIARKRFNLLEVLIMSASITCRASAFVFLISMVLIPIISQYSSLTSHFPSFRENPTPIKTSSREIFSTQSVLAAKLKSLLQDSNHDPGLSVSMSHPHVPNHVINAMDSPNSVNHKALVRDSVQDSQLSMSMPKTHVTDHTTNAKHSQHPDLIMQKSCPEPPICAPCNDTSNEKRALEDSSLYQSLSLPTAMHRHQSNFEGSMTYYETFRPFLEHHEQFWKLHPRSLPPGYREYEPLTYTDDVKLDYAISGLQNITVMQESTFFIDTHGIVSSDLTYEFVRVFFYGISAFCPQQMIPHSKGLWEAKFRVNDPGLYQVHIESVRRVRAEGTHLYRAIAGSPFTMLVRPAGMDHMTDDEVIENLRTQGKDFRSSTNAHTHPPVSLGQYPPGKVNYPSELCKDGKWKYGRWVRCVDTPEPCIRTGWIWLPEECHYHVFTPEEIVSVPKPIWIVIAGSSVQRGTYFAFVDLLSQGGAKNLTNSPFWKCWGWMDFSSKNFRVSYLDFRTPYLYPVPNWVQNQYVEPNYFTNGLLALSELGKMDGGGPDLFYIEDQPPTIFLHPILKSWLGLDWKGRFVVHSTKPPAGLDIGGWRLQHSLQGKRQAFWDEFEQRSFSGMEVVDEDMMTLVFMHDQEQHMSKGVSQHFHRSCDEAGMYSCSVICDMAAQQLLNVFMNSPKVVEKTELRPVKDVGTGFDFCLRCPKDLIPFTIRPTFQDVKCYDYIPSS